MSKVRIFFNPLDAKSKVEFPIEPGTRLIDFLQEHYPSGFDGFLRAYVGRTEYAIDDLDYVVEEGDSVTFLIMPSGPETQILIAGYAIQAAIAVAIGFVITLIFKPSVYSSSGGGEESPVYSLSPTRNDARLGSPIASHYGTVSYPPDFSSAPYTFYNEGSNDQYIDELLCLGHGEFEIQEIYVGDTPVSSIEAGSVDYWIIPESIHEQTMGKIEDYTWQTIQNSSSPVPFKENVFTSPEVESWEFNSDRSDAVPVGAPFSGNALNANYSGGEYIQGRFTLVPDTIVVVEGDTLSLTGTDSNNDDFKISSVVPDGTGTQSIFIVDADPVNFEVPLNAAAQYTLNTAVDNMIAGPFRCQKVGDRVTSIECDILWPQGLYRVDGTSGNIKTLTVEMQYTYQRIDDLTGAPIDAPIIKTTSTTSKKRNAQRMTVSSGELPYGAYECTVQRLTPIDDDNRKVDATVWAGLKGIIQLDTTNQVYGKTTQLAVRLKATNGLAAAARARIRVTAKRILAEESSNPVVAIKDIWTNTDYGMSRSLSELDMDQLNYLQTLFTDNSVGFNGSFDQRSTGFEAMQAVASMCAGKVVQNGSLTTVVLDMVQDVRRAMFSSANITLGSFQIQYSFDTDGDFDGVEIEYRNPDTFDIQYARYPEASQEPESFNLFGCTDETYAEQFAVYMWNVKSSRRKQVQLQTELEGLIPRFGDRIAVSHPMPDWGQSGVFVEQIDELTWQVDQPLNWTGNDWMTVKNDWGEPTDSFQVSQGPHPNQVTFLAAPPITINDPQDRDPTNYAFGTQYNYISDFLITKITPKGDTAVQVDSQTYLDSIYTGGPPHMQG